MSDDRVVVRCVAWRELCPWLMLFRSFRLALSMPVIFLATLGTFLTPVGWYAADLVFQKPVESARKAADSDVLPQRGAGMATTDLPRKIAQLGWERSAAESLRRSVWTVPEVYWQFTKPFWGMLNRKAQIGEVAHTLFGAIWNVLVWAFVGGAITRIAALQFGREERIGFGESVRHVAKNYLWYFVAPFFPLVGVVVLAVPVAVLGVFMRLDFGVFFAGLLWILVLIGGSAMATLLLGLLFGWPLMWPTISSEESGDAFEAFSRSFSYTFQRPLSYLFYAFVTVLFGAICGLFVSGFASAVLETSYWAAAWGAGVTRIDGLHHEALASPEGGLLLQAGIGLIYSLSLAVQKVAEAFNFAFFWCASTAIYLLLRREVDQTEFDEVWVESEQEKYALPPIETEKTAQGVSDGPADTAHDKNESGSPAPSPADQSPSS